MQTVLSEQTQPSLVQGHVEVRTIQNRRVTATVLGEQGPGDPLLADIGRVADDDIKGPLKGCEQKIIADQPSSTEGFSRQDARAQARA